MSTTSLVTGRNALIASAVSLALAPLSTIIGFYLGQSLGKPKESAVKVDVSISNLGTVPLSPDATAILKENGMLWGTLHQYLSHKCHKELDTGAVTQSCAADVGARLPILKNTLDTDLKFYKEDLATCEHWKPGLPLTLTPVELPNLNEPIEVAFKKDRGALVEQLKNMLQTGSRFYAALDVLAADLERVKVAPANPVDMRTSFVVGVLNSGQTDGVVYPNAELDVAGANIPLIALTHLAVSNQDVVSNEDDAPSGLLYTVVRAHSFATPNFEVDVANTPPAVMAQWNHILTSRAQEEMIIKVWTESGELRAPPKRLPPPK
jgi:hypothetical protein